MTPTTKHEITEEQLASLESDYITKESAAIIANEVRKTQMEVGAPPELIERAITMLSALCLRYGSCWIYHNVEHTEAETPYDDDYSDTPTEDFCTSKCPANKGARNGCCNIREFFSDCEAAGIKIPYERGRW